MKDKMMGTLDYADSDDIIDDTDDADTDSTDGENL
jgi:hypothetical protein